MKALFDSNSTNKYFTEQFLFFAMDFLPNGVMALNVETATSSKTPKSAVKIR